MLILEQLSDKHDDAQAVARAQPLDTHGSVVVATVIHVSTEQCFLLARAGQEKEPVVVVTHSYKTDRGERAAQRRLSNAFNVSTLFSKDGRKKEVEEFL
ncbi:hypothetical protein PAMA_015540 [Pampus argenteus]